MASVPTIILSVLVASGRMSFGAIKSVECPFSSTTPTSTPASASALSLSLSLLRPPNQLMRTRCPFG
jgi:hypothetical protein